MLRYIRLYCGNLYLFIGLEPEIIYAFTVYGCFDFYSVLWPDFVCISAHYTYVVMMMIMIQNSSCVLQDGELMVSDNRVEINTATGVVRFRTVNKADEGSYMCTASNNVGNASAIGFIKVHGAYC